MSIAKTVKKIEFDWLTVEDEDGSEWTYDRTQVIGSGPVHVECRYSPSDGRVHAELSVDRDGKPILRRDGPGLPETIVVDCIPAEGMRSRASGPVEYRFRPTTVYLEQAR